MSSAVSTIDIGVAKHFKWHVSPDDFEDSPRGSPATFCEHGDTIGKGSFLSCDQEYPQSTFTDQAPLPTLLTSFPKPGFAQKPAMQSFIPLSALPPVPSFAPPSTLVPQACLLATGLSRVGDIPQMDYASRHFNPGMQMQHCSVVTLPAQTSVADFRTSDPCADLWHEPLPCASDMILPNRMCDYCRVRPAMYRSEYDENVEIYCDACRINGAQRWCAYRAPKCTDGNNNDHGMQQCDLEMVNSPPAPHVSKPAPQVSQPLASQVTERCASGLKGDVRKKGRSKKAASKSLIPQAPAPAPLGVFPTDWEEGTTTVMMKNIPSRYTVEELVSEMITKNYQEKFDFLYLPMDFKTKRNKGYAFINFISNQDARQFYADFDGVQLPKYATQKTLQIARAETQGLGPNLKAAQRDKPRIQNPWFRPMVFNIGEDDQLARQSEA